MYIAVGFEYLNPDQVRCANALLIQICLNRFVVCKQGYRRQI